jgi:hypothetical protein
VRLLLLLLLLHRHGMLQMKTNIMDGVTGITQRPVLPGSKPMAGKPFHAAAAAAPVAAATAHILAACAIMRSRCTATAH